MLSQELFAWLSYGQAARLAKGEVDTLVCEKSRYFILFPPNKRILAFT